MGNAEIVWRTFKGRLSELIKLGKKFFDTRDNLSDGKNEVDKNNNGEKTGIREKREDKALTEE